MANSFIRVKQHLDHFSPENTGEGPPIHNLRRIEHPIPPHVPKGTDQTAITERWNVLKASEEIKCTILDAASLDEYAVYHRSIENYIGTVKIPIGLAGPLRISGTNAQGDFYIPMATVEPTLVASYNRGAQCITRAGGCTTVLWDHGVIRSPGFMFHHVLDCSTFASWAMNHYEEIKAVSEQTTKYGKLIDMKVHITGKYLWLIFEFSTGDASGQNMVTIATQAILHYIIEHAPIQPEWYTIDANMSSDKKASVQTFQSVRGRKVTAEVTLPGSLVKEMLNATPEDINRYAHISYVGGVSSGTIGVQGHYANGLTAVYIACGQDAACVAESAVGITCVDVTDKGDLYMSITLPNIMVGTVGGGTGLPSQKACLDIMGLYGPGQANALAEVCAAICLAGDISMLAALSCHEFASAHKKFARGG